MLAETTADKLHWIDWSVIGVYLVALLGMGLYYRKFADQGVTNYFLAGRNLKGWLNGISNAVTCMNADVAPFYCGLTVTVGASICWFYFSRFGLSLMVAGILFAALWRRSGVSTSPEFYELRYGGQLGLTIRTLMSLRNGLIGPMIWIGAGLLALSTVAKSVIGWDQWFTLSLVIPIILVYVSLSGYVGVVMSDFLQTILLLGSSAVLCILVLVDFGGPSGLFTALQASELSTAADLLPPIDHREVGLVALVAWMIGTTIGSGGDPSFDSQKLLSCKNTREASKMYIWAEVFLFLMLALLTLPALSAIIHWPELATTGHPEHSYGKLLMHYLPTGLLGLALAALLASLMSTIDSHLNFAGQVFVNDVYQRLINPAATMRQNMLAGKISMVVAMTVAVIVAYMFDSLLDIASAVLIYFYVEFSANWAQWWWWRFNAKARLASFFAGPTIAFINSKWVFPLLLGMNDVKFEAFLTSIAMTTLIWFFVALVTKPEPRTKLMEFYTRCRPLGWWGPVAKDCNLPYAGPLPIFKGLGIAFLGMVAVSSGIMMLTSLYVGDWLIAGISVAGLVVGGFLFKMTYGPFMDLIDSNQETAEDITP